MPDDRPSFGQALAESGASDAGGFDAPVETVSDAPDVSASSADDTPLTGQPAATPITSPEAGASPSTSAPRGPIPFERHEAVLKNTRTEYEQKLAALSWAQDIPPEQAAQVASFVQQAAGNPVEFVMSYADALLQNPEHAAALRSYAARTLGTRAAAAQPQQPPMAAGPDLGPVLEIDGIPLPTKAQREAQEQDLIRRVVDAVTQEVGGRIAPVESVAQALAQAKKDQAESEARTATARSLMQTASKWEGWADHKVELAAALEEARQQPGYDDTDPAKMGQILRDLYIERVVPKLRTTAQAGLLRDLKTRAGELGSSPAGAKTAAAVSHARPTWDNVFQSI